MLILLFSVLVGVNSQMFFDKVMNYNAKAKQFLEEKESEQPAYPPKPMPLIESLQ